MHLEAVVPGLLSAPPELRLPALELLLARGRAARGARCSLEEWLGDAFGLGEGPVPAGALSLLAAGGAPGDAAWMRADPVHLHLARDHLVLVPGAALELTREESAQICGALNSHFSGLLDLHAVDAERWTARFGTDCEVNATSAFEAAGRDFDPAGDGRGHALLNEIQMLLHAHPVNAAREARGAFPVNSLWLWGAGRLPGELRAHWSSVSAAEPLALGLGRQAGIRPRALPVTAEEWLARAPEEGRHLVVLCALRAPLALGDGEGFAQQLRRLEERWFAPLLSALRAGKISMITIRIPDAKNHTSFETIRADLRRFWRRPQALARYS